MRLRRISERVPVSAAFAGRTHVRQHHTLDENGARWSLPGPRAARSACRRNSRVLSNDSVTGFAYSACRHAASPGFGASLGSILVSPLPSNNAWVCQPVRATTTSPLANAGLLDAITSETAPPAMTPPIGIGAA